MPRVLITSVGGSCEPVINACREYKPDFIYFFCSAGPKGSSVTVDGEGDPCGDKRSIKCASCGADIPLGNPKGEAIVKRLGLRPDSYEKVQVDDPDDLEACYTALLETEEKIVKRFGSRAEVIANYTGGTKTMSAALALIAVFRERWDLSVNKGPRVDLIKVRSGDMPVLAGKLPAVLESYKTQAARFLKHYAYDVADAVLADLTSGRYLSAADRQKFLRVQNSSGSGGSARPFTPGIPSITKRRGNCCGQQEGTASNPSSKIWRRLLMRRDEPGGSKRWGTPEFIS